MVKIVIVLATLLAASLLVMKFIVVKNDVIGLTLAKLWCSEVGIEVDTSTCISTINSQHYVIVQSLSLAIFLFVIAMTVMKTEWRVAAAILGVAILILTGVSNPKGFIEAVSWNLILFLIGSMVFAGILRELGVFRFLAIQILRVSKGSVYLLLFLISMLAFSLSAIVGEVTSIVYITMLVLELKKILRVDIEPLIILSVLTTNTGSSALPIGNPIGVYILFQSRLSVSQFNRYALPLAVINLLVLYILYIVVSRKYVDMLKEVVKKYINRVEAFITSFYTKIYNARATKIKIGVVLLILFALTVALNDPIVHILSRILGIDIDPHSFLTFIPYIYIVFSMFIAVPLEEISILVSRAVEWSSIVFFIMLFMLGYSLLHTGAMPKLAYALSTISTSPLALLTLMVISSATLSAVLDNLSVIVAFTPIAMLFVNAGLISSIIFFALLFGGVFGGNYTPIGSTANIVALSMAEKEKVKLSWRRWLSIALITTTTQIAIAVLWIIFNQIML